MVHTTGHSTVLVSTHDNQPSYAENRKYSNVRRISSKIILDKFREIVANIPKMNFYSSYFPQYNLQNDGVGAICMEGSQSQFRIKRGSWCCHWMQYAARDLIRPRYLFSLNDNPRCVKRFCIMSLIFSSSIEQNGFFVLFFQFC